MEELQNKFTQVANLVKKVKTQPTDKELLKSYKWDNNKLILSHY